MLILQQVTFCPPYQSLEDSLINIDTTISTLDDQINNLDNEIKHCIREQSYASDNARDQLKIINEESASLIDRI